MKQKHFLDHHDDPTALLSAAMGLGRVLAAKIREVTWFATTSDRSVLDDVARAGGERRFLDPYTRGSIDRLLMALDRAIEAASEDRVAAYITGFHGYD